MISLPLTIAHSARFVNSAALDAARPVWYTESMNEKLRPVISIRIFRETKCFGPGVAELLRHVREAHSLRGAAMTMGMAYSKAWTIVKQAERELGFPLLVSVTGGRQARRRRGAFPKGRAAACGLWGLLRPDAGLCRRGIRPRVCGIHGGAASGIGIRNRNKQKNRAISPCGIARHIFVRNYSCPSGFFSSLGESSLLAHSSAFSMPTLAVRMSILPRPAKA